MNTCGDCEHFIVILQGRRDEDGEWIKPCEVGGKLVRGDTPAGDCFSPWRVGSLKGL